ncbi:terminase small subunit [Bacillus licheniformis]|nr:terminase small subunit [Bacillus licheniformis]
MFCLYYIKYFNATKAYQKAYGCSYLSAKTEGHKTLAKPYVKKKLKD